MTAASSQERATSNEVPSVWQLRHPAELQLASMDPGAEEPTLRKFDMLAHTGKAVPSSYGPVVFDLSTLAEPSRCVVLRDHDDARVVGRATACSIANSLRITGELYDSADSQDLQRLADPPNNFDWQASPRFMVDRFDEIEAGQAEIVNGRAVEGPALIARGLRMPEVSFVSLGRDDETYAVALSSSTSVAIQRGGPVSDAKIAPATIAELKANYQDSDFVLSCAERGLTLSQAESEWSKLEVQRLKQERDALEREKAELAAQKAEHEKALAQIKHNSSRPDLSGAHLSVGGDGREVIENPGAEFKRLVAANVKLGMKPDRAISAVTRTHPEIHQAYLAQVNGGVSLAQYRTGVTA